LAAPAYRFSVIAGGATTPLISRVIPSIILAPHDGLAAGKGILNLSICARTIRTAAPKMGLLDVGSDRKLSLNAGNFRLWMERS
jgi:hypothetical protein